MKLVLDANFYLRSRFGGYDISAKTEQQAIMKEIAQNTYTWSQVYVPVDTGDLKKSGKLTTLGVGDYMVSYLTPYAVYVHEIMYHRHDAPSKAQFLLEGFKFALLTAIRKYGREAIPEFTVYLAMGIDVGVNLHMRMSRTGRQGRLSWRRFL